jgi:hypothetical protein
MQMSRNFPNLLDAYVKYASVTEAPKRMHFWAGVSMIAGALRRKVWIDMARFQWLCNMYIVFVAPPGVVSKSTTTDIAMELLREVPGIKFGPDVVTWPALVSAFAESSESFLYNEEWHTMSPLTLVASEMGSLINPQDREMVNLYITLWDGRKTFEKVTKMSGNDTVEAPWINMLACTTPHWIADNMPAATIGGGFTSRCVFVYADTKEKYIPFVDEMADSSDGDTRRKLIEDLEHIATNIVGPYKISPAARDWYRPIYEEFWNNARERMDNTVLEGYAARKQTHLFKTALVIAVAQRDERIIQIEDLQIASMMLADVEAEMDSVFSRIGRTEDSLHAERFVQFVIRKGGVPYDEAYRMVYNQFPDFRDFEGVVSGAVRSGQVTLEQRGSAFWLVATKPSPAEHKAHAGPSATLDMRMG